MNPKVTFGRVLEVLKLNNNLNEETRITWVVFVDETNYEMLESLKTHVSLGSIIFGIEWFDNEGYLCKGALYIEPEPVSDKLN